MNHRHIFSQLVLVTAVIGGTAQAATVTYFYEATVTAPGGTNLPVGEVISGYYKIDDAMTKHHPASNSGTLAVYQGVEASHMYANHWEVHGIGPVGANVLDPPAGSLPGKKDGLYLFSYSHPQNGSEYVQLTLNGTPSTLMTRGALPTSIDLADDQVKALRMSFSTDGPWGACALSGCLLVASVDSIGVVTDARSVSIDVQPVSATNQVNPAAAGSILVALLSTPVIDAPGVVDAATVRFGSSGVEAPSSGMRISDVNGDGLNDAVFQFSTTATGLHCKSSMAVLTGATLTGQFFRGTDTITPVACGGNGYLPNSPERP
jgi:hypothetical protein